MADKPPVRWSREAMTEAGNQTVWMTPDEYLSLSPQLEGQPWQSAKGRSLQESLSEGGEVYEVPSLKVKKGQVVHQDGRHRALAAKEAGIRMIPVKLEGDQIAKDLEITGVGGAKVKLQGEPMSWHDVMKSPEYRKLTQQERLTARFQYFDDVVAPRIAQQDYTAARQQFAEDTKSRRSPKEMAPPDPTEGMSDRSKFFSSFGRLIPELGRGTGKLVRDVAELVPGGKRGSDLLGLPDDESIKERERLDAPLLNTGSGMAGDITRNVATAVPLVFAPGANTVLGSGLYGGASTLIDPSTSWAERGEKALTAGGVSSGVTGSVRLLPALWKGLISPMAGGGRNALALSTINRFAKDPNAIENAMAKPPPTGAAAVDELVPGSRATLAEVTGDPGIAQAQRAAHAASPDVANALATSRTARLEARKNALLKVAGGPGGKETAEAVREATAERLYREAWAEPLKKANIKALQPEMKSLLERPSIQRARQSALEIAKEEGEKLTAADMKAGSLKSLHYMKKALDREISSAKSKGDMAEVRRIVGTQQKLLGVMDGLSPSYKTARQEYARLSKPVNQADIGRYLYDKLVPAISDLGAERLTPSNFSRVLKEGNEMAKKATGFSGAKLKDILTTEQWNTIINLGKDLGREAGALERGKVTGSPTAQYLAGRNVMRQILGPAGLPESWAEKMTTDLLANKWTSMIASPVERDIQNRLAAMLADPRKALEAQRALAASQKGILPRTANALNKYAVPPVSIGAGNIVSNNQ